MEHRFKKFEKLAQIILSIRFAHFLEHRFKKFEKLVQIILSICFAHFIEHRFKEFEKLVQIMLSIRFAHFLEHRFKKFEKLAQIMLSIRFAHWVWNMGLSFDLRFAIMGSRFATPPFRHSSKGEIYEGVLEWFGIVLFCGSVEVGFGFYWEMVFFSEYSGIEHPILCCSLPILHGSSATY